MEKRDYQNIIFTDLDGTLLDEDYSFAKAKSSLELLKKKKIPLIICSSKTNDEIEVYRKKLRNKDPFIPEDGGAIYIPKNYFKKTKIKYDKKIPKYYLIEFGTDYKKLKKVLKKINKKTKAKIIAFSDMSVEDLMKESGLNKEEAKLAKKRSYDEAFMIFGKSKNKKKVLKEIKKRGYDYKKGGRYYHILKGNNKGKAVKRLKKIYREHYGKIRAIGFGDSENDRDFLKEMDKAFLLQKPDRSYAKTKDKIIKKVNGVGPEGWNRKIKDLFWELNRKKAEKLYKKSIKILKKNQLANGGIYASPPKKRYPYIYSRDHSISILGFIDSGILKCAKKGLAFILETQKKSGAFPQRVSKKGKDASYKPIQLDSTALVLYAFSKYIKESSDESFFKENKDKIKKAIKYLKSKLDKKKNLFLTPNSVHEFPSYEKGFEVWANATTYGALRMLEKIGIKHNIDLKKVKKAISKYLWNGKYFIKNIRIKESSSVVGKIDVSSYALEDYRVFDHDNKKVVKTINRIERELWHPKLGGICRYKKEVGRNNGGWGPWPIYTLMIARHHIREGNRKKAETYLGWILEISRKGELPEHIALKKEFERWVKESKKAGILRKDREIMVRNIRKNKMYKKGKAYSVLPLVWSHAEFIRTWKLFKEKFKEK